VTIAYVAYTERSVLMLDDGGVCVRVEPLSGRNLTGYDAGDGALRCVGAQYIASIDPTVPGGLGRAPRAGTSMLFAAVGQDGRIFCVRAGPLTHFESTKEDDSGVHTLRIETPKQAGLELCDATDPDLHIPFLDDDDVDDDMRTIVRTPPLRSWIPPISHTGRSPRDPGPPPPPRVPRLRPSLESIPAWQLPDAAQTALDRRRR
jgi:hypothetical protein